MAELQGPDGLRSLAADLDRQIPRAQVSALTAYADAWEADRVSRLALEEQLAETLKQVEVLEADRKWWRDNALKRSKRAAARRSAGAPRGTERKPRR